MPVFSDPDSTIQCGSPDFSKISPREMKIGLRNQEVHEIKSKIIVFPEDLRNRDSTVHTRSRVKLIRIYVSCTCILPTPLLFHYCAILTYLVKRKRKI